MRRPSTAGNHDSSSLPASPRHWWTRIEPHRTCILRQFLRPLDLLLFARQRTTIILLVDKLINYESVTKVRGVRSARRELRSRPARREVFPLLAFPQHYRRGSLLPR